MPSYLLNVLRRGALPLVGPGTANSSVKPSRRFEQAGAPETHLFETERSALSSLDQAEPPEPGNSSVEPRQSFEQTEGLDTHLLVTSHSVSHATSEAAPLEPAVTGQHEATYVEKKLSELAADSIEESNPPPSGRFAEGRGRVTPTPRFRETIRELTSEPSEASISGIEEVGETAPAALHPNVGTRAFDSFEGPEGPGPARGRADSNMASQSGIEPVAPEAASPAAYWHGDNQPDTAFIKIPGSLYGQQSPLSDLIQVGSAHETHVDSHAAKAGQTSSSGSIKSDGDGLDIEPDTTPTAPRQRLLAQSGKSSLSPLPFPGMSSASKGLDSLSLHEVTDATDQPVSEGGRSESDRAKEKSLVSEALNESIRAQADLVPGKTREKLPVGIGSATASPRADGEPRLRINSLEIRIINDARDRNVRNAPQTSSARSSPEPASLLERNYLRHLDLIF